MKSVHGTTRETRTKLLVEARALLTPRVHGSTDEWVEARIRWHRLDGNDALADALLKEENAVREALGKDLIAG